MCSAMRHRGPDEDGFLVGEARAPGLALGMRRLSIIDLAGGHQPIWNETKDVAVVFNGELYNYRELRERYATAPILFLARDPLGIKPLYYTQTPEGFAFASEVRALLAAGVAPRQLSKDALTS